MNYEIVLELSAIDEWGALPASDRASVKEALSTRLRHEPTDGNGHDVERLRGLSHPQYRLHTHGVRVYYDVVRDVVTIVAIVPDSD